MGISTDEVQHAAQPVAGGSAPSHTDARRRSDPWALLLRLPPEPRTVTLCRSDIGVGGERLPYPDRSIDCVVLQGEAGSFVGQRDDPAPEESGKYATLKALLCEFRFRARRKSRPCLLAEARRILKPDGQIVLLVGNRYDHGYFRRQRDPCSGLRYTSLLPRLVANAYSILATGKPYRACTHSLGAYRRALRAAGYASVEFCGLTPDCAHPKELIPFRARGQTWRVTRSRGLDRIRRHRRFVPAYGIIASATTLQRAAIAAEIAREIEVSLNADPGSCVFSAFRITSKNKGIIKGQVADRQIIVKVAFDTAAESGNQRNYRFLERAGHIGELREMVPRRIATGSVRGIPYYAETRARGIVLDDAVNPDNATRFLAGITQALCAINPDLPDRQPQPFSGDVYRRQVLDPLDRLEQSTGKHSLMENVRARFHSCLNGASIRQGLVHGDFCSSNITVVDYAVTGIIDWEDACDAGIPALDALNYLEPLYRDFRYRGAPTAAVLSALGQWDQLAAAEQRFLEEHYLRCGLGRASHLVLTYLYWVHHVADQLDGGLENDLKALDERVVRPLEQFVAGAQARS